MMMFYEFIELEVNEKEVLCWLAGSGAITLERLVYLTIQLCVCKLYSSSVPLNNCFCSL